MKTIVAKRPDIAFYIKVFLLNPTAQSRKTATGIVCSKSDAALENAYQKKTAPNQECATKEIDENLKFADENSINSAPALIFPDGIVHFGFLDAAALEKRIDKATGKEKRGSEGRRVGGSAN